MIFKKRKPGVAADKVADMLMEFGFAVDPFAFSVVRGGASHKTEDIVQRWSIIAGDRKDGRKNVEIQSCYTLTECARRGIWLRINPPDSDVYGDYEVIPKSQSKPVGCIELIPTE